MAKRTLIAKLEGQQVGNRKTDRPYGAAIVILFSNRPNKVLSWHRDAGLAQKALKAELEYQQRTRMQQTTNAEWFATPNMAEWLNRTEVLTRRYCITTDISER